jgi:hypothetical protein
MKAFRDYTDKLLALFFQLYNSNDNSQRVVLEDKREIEKEKDVLCSFVIHMLRLQRLLLSA